MIIVTGAAGFIGSAMVSSLNNKGLNDVIAVDDFSRQDKNRNLTGKSLIEKIHRDHFFDWALPKATDIDFVFHLDKVEGDDWEENIDTSGDLIKDISLGKQEIIDRINAA
ncbi:MAG: NAD-dependent epimerase/dehydratase family protein, partial [Bacteroidales bacterium]